ncbi:MAG: class IV adenylate cyclase [Candidatus Acidiferrales bacterium]
MPQPQKTNSEIEIKLPVTDPRATIRAIRALGATSHGRTFESNTLYDTPHSDLRKSGRLLRVRIEHAAPGTTRTQSTRVRRILLTSKGPSAQHGAKKKNPRYKERTEREVVTSRHFPDWHTTLASLGFERAFRYEKYRTSFRLCGLHLDLDETPLGTFLELEGHPTAIDRVARALGYTPAAYIRGTYWDVYAADCRRQNRKPSNMVFPKK